MSKTIILIATSPGLRRRNGEGKWTCYWEGTVIAANTDRPFADGVRSLLADRLVQPDDTVVCRLGDHDAMVRRVDQIIRSSH